MNMHNLPFNDFEINAIIHGAKRKSKFVGSGTLHGTYRNLLEQEIIKPSLMRNNNSFYDFFLTEYGYQLASSIIEYERL